MDNTFKSPLHETFMEEKIHDLDDLRRDLKTRA